MPLISSLGTIQGALIFVGLKGLPATTANLVLQIQVPMAVILGWLVGGEILGLRKSIGTLIALAGVAMVIGLPEETPPLLPVALIIAGAFAWALGQVLARAWATTACAFSAPSVQHFQLLLATIMFEDGQLAALQTASPAQWAALLFVGVIGFYAAYAAWYSLLRQCRMDEVAPFVLLMPVFGIVSAFLVLGEFIAPAQIAGGLVILAGLATVSGLAPAATVKAGH
jgi:O-acetylserine/cysteine efflux transporter